MKKISIFSAIIGLLIYGCSSNEEVYNNYHKEGDKSFRVTVEQPVFNETRAQLDNAYNVVFEDKDEIAVFEDNKVSKYVYSGDIFVEDQSGDGSTLEGEALDGIYALYPYSAAKTHNSGTLPAKQTYRENSFSNESQIMYGQTDNIENGFNLKNMCGYIRLHLYGENVFVKDITLSVTGEGEYVSGDFYIDTNGDEPSLKMYGEDETHTSQSQSTTLVCSNEEGVALGNENSPTVFYIALPPQEYKNGFSIIVKDIFGREFTKTASTSLELKRNHIKPMEALEVAFGADELVIVKGTDEKQYAKVSTSQELLKWGYTLNNVNKNLGMILEDDIELPLYTVEVNPTDGTYQFTDTPITLNADGTPTGSNWISVCSGISSLSEAFSGHIDGIGKTIKGLRILQNTDQVGFIGAMFDDASIKNLTFEDVVVKGNTETGAVAGRSHNGTLIENVYVVNSKIFGTSRVGGIVGMNYRRVRPETPDKQPYDEKLSFIKNCTTDSQTAVIGSSSQVGGICGRNDGAIILHCTNNADVTGYSWVGGVVGETCSYNFNRINGYVIASGSTENASIKATSNESKSGYAGGIVGCSYHNASHTNSNSYIIACYSTSTIEAQHPGTLIGTSEATDRFGAIVSSWAKRADEMKYSGRYSTDDCRTESDHYTEANLITSEIIVNMNQAIEGYNDNVVDYQADVVEKVKCHYKWQYNAGGWPTLIPITPSGGN